MIFNGIDWLFWFRTETEKIKFYVSVKGFFFFFLNDRFSLFGAVVILNSLETKGTLSESRDSVSL